MELALDQVPTRRYKPHSRVNDPLLCDLVEPIPLLKKTFGDQFIRRAVARHFGGSYGEQLTGMRRLLSDFQNRLAACQAAGHPLCRIVPQQLAEVNTMRRTLILGHWAEKGYE